MPEHRLIYAKEIVDAGLAAPDDATMTLLEQIVDEGVLGASNHIRLTHDLLLHLMAADADPNTAWLRAEMTASFVARVRGAQAPVVNTAIQALMSDIDRLDPAERLSALKQRIGDWQATAASHRERLVHNAVEVLRPVRRLIPFDYSSTVADIVVAVWQRLLLVLPRLKRREEGRLMPFDVLHRAGQLRGRLGLRLARLLKGFLVLRDGPRLDVAKVRVFFQQVRRQRVERAQRSARGREAVGWLVRVKSEWFPLRGVG